MDIVNESFSKTMLHILKHPKQQIINDFLKNITIQWLGQFSWIVGFYYTMSCFHYATTQRPLQQIECS